MSGNIAIIGNKIKLPKLGFVRIAKSRGVVKKSGSYELDF